MEKFRKTVKRRIAISSGMALVSLVLGAFSIYSIIYTDHSTATHSDGFVAGFQFGLIISILGFSLFDIVKLSLAIKDETKLKILYNKEHDERMKTIRSKAGMPLIAITSMLMVIAAIVAGYFNIVVFYTLVIAVAAQLSVSAMVKLYCLKTM
jgi:tellurite resistance protein TehA-like permease